MFGTKKKVISSERQAGVLQGCRKWLDLKEGGTPGFIRSRSWKEKYHSNQVVKPGVSPSSSGCLSPLSISLFLLGECTLRLSFICTLAAYKPHSLCLLCLFTSLKMAAGFPQSSDPTLKSLLASLSSNSKLLRKKTVYGSLGSGPVWWCRTREPACLAKGEKGDWETDSDPPISSQENQALTLTAYTKQIVWGWVLWVMVKRFKFQIKFQRSWLVYGRKAANPMAAFACSEGVSKMSLCWEPPGLFSTDASRGPMSLYPSPVPTAAKTESQEVVWFLRWIWQILWSLRFLLN